MDGELFTTIRSVGGLLPSDLLRRVADTDADLPAMSAQDYHLASGERVRDVIARSWARMQGAWSGFVTERERLPSSDRGTTVTRERWLQVLFQELGWGRLPTQTAIEVAGTDYPVSHGRGDTPVHLVSWKLDLDVKVEGVAGAARWSPHAMVQELLNRSPEHLWGLVSNGEKLRVLRDNRSLTRQAYVEFDLAGMMDGEAYSDFVVLWLVCHESRFDAERPELCVLEQWVDTAAKEGTRALDELRDGVEDALTTLGSGLVAHPANTALRAALDAGDVSPIDMYRQLLRVVYRLLFLFVAEDRDLLLQPEDEAKPGARQRYTKFYSTRRLRSLARAQTGGPHGDLWRQVTLVFDLVGSDVGEEGLALPPLGGGLWAPDTTADVIGTQHRHTELANRDLLEALRRLAWTVDDNIARPIDYRNLGAEEFGSVYESLLELHPQVSLAHRTFALTAGAGNERKTTGSYYTPSSLISQLLDTALDPVLDEAVKADDPENALLDLSVCDPACGSGHFLVAAAHRIAERLATVRTGDSQPSLEAVQAAMRDVVSRCIYGVDVNPMAVELAKLSLWVEAQVPGKPLTFLDHHIKQGNAVLGTTPALVARGIPNDAFKAIEGDDKKYAKEFRKANKLLRGGQQDLLALAAEAEGRYDVLSGAAEAVTELDDDDIESLHAKEAAHADFEGSEALRKARLAADAWCATFTFPKVKVDDNVRDQHPHELFYELRDGTAPALSPAHAVVANQQSTYDFFHWHLEFPHLFEVSEDPASDDHLGWSGGFSVMLGNPPWERVKLQQKEFFESRDPDIANAPNAAARKAMIQDLAKAKNPLYTEYLAAKREAEAASHLLRDTGRFPLGGVGDVNTYQVFAELFRDTIDGHGRTGFIVPTGIATDYTTRHYFASLVSTKQLASLYDFENRAGLFPTVDSRMKFSLITLAGRDAGIEAAEFAFFAHDVSDLRDPERRFALTPDDIALINPNTKTAPVFRTRRDAEICAKIYRNVPVLIREGDGDEPDENPWGIEFLRMFDMSNDSDLFRTRDQLEADGWTLTGNVFHKDGDQYLPLYEAKMIHQFDHRWATYEPDGSTRLVTDAEKADPTYEPLPRYWVPKHDVDKQLAAKNWQHDWLTAFRRISNVTNERTGLFTMMPATGAGDSVFLMLPDVARDEQAWLISALNSFASDFVMRRKMGGTNMNFFLVKQFPVPLQPGMVEATSPIHRAVMQAAKYLGYNPGPAERDQSREVVDAGFFHFYGLDRDQVDYVMETFPIVKRKDITEHGEYRTKRLILKIYDEMADAIRTGQPYQTRLDPPPADPSLQVTP